VGCSIGNSKSQLHKARMKLRDLLKMNRAEKAEQKRDPAQTGHGGNQS
jgi:hypothetical protein